MDLQIQNTFYSNILFYFSLTGTTCISEIRVQNRTDTSITFCWTVPAPGLSYSILVCPENTSRCLPRVTCTDCNLYHASGLSPNTNYTVTVDSFSRVTSGECISQGCTSNTATAQTGIYTSGSVHKGHCSVYIPKANDRISAHTVAKINVVS